MNYQVLVFQLCFNFSLELDRKSGCSFKLATKKKKKARKRRAHASPLNFFFFFAPFSICQISHNYVIPQAMPHAIPQTHSAFCPHRFKGSLKSPNVTANVWVMEVEVGGIQTLSPYRWQFSFSKVWMLSINTSLASLLKRDLKKEITIDLILIEDSRGKKTQGLDDLDLTLHTYKGEYILTWQLTHLLCRLNFRSRW